jgi:hypothetical protein
MRVGLSSDAASRLMLAVCPLIRAEEIGSESHSGPGKNGR